MGSRMGTDQWWMLSFDSEEHRPWQDSSTTLVQRKPNTDKGSCASTKPCPNLCQCKDKIQHWWKSHLSPFCPILDLFIKASMGTILHGFRQIPEKICSYNDIYICSPIAFRLLQNLVKTPAGERPQRYWVPKSFLQIDGWVISETNKTFHILTVGKAVAWEFISF